jgi:UDP-N-acetylmuramoylalanine--D-glutamate ligase
MLYKPDKQKVQSENPLVLNRLKNLREQQPYAMEPAGMVGGIVVVNDGAATSLEALALSLSAFEEPVVWIVEASANHPDFSQIIDIIGAKVKVTIAMGSHADEIHNAIWPSLGYFISAHSWEEAVELGLMTAKTNDTLLFSPGCRANEPFQNFRERGAYFNQLIDIKRNTKT